MPSLLAAVLVFFSSGAVLVLEILAARLLAPYVGDTLETYTAIIGVLLAGIALGSWYGGRLADRYEPRDLLGPMFVIGGALTFLSVPAVDFLGTGMRGASPLTTTLLTVLAFFLPATVLSGVTPTVIKIQLGSLEETGSVVGRLSALSTVGGIFGTFLTGFVLVAAWPSRPVVRVQAALLIAAGIALAVYLRRLRTVSVGTMAAAAIAGLLSFAASHPCEHESAYYCAYITEDPDREGGRSLWLDTLRHSYVDLDDPDYLEFTYMRWFSDVLDAVAPDGEPIDALHIGGAGFTMPRYLRAEHPGSESTVLELDPLMVELAEDELGLERGDDLDIHTGDARVAIEQVDEDAFDVAIGDAFGGVSVPWHLATREYVTDVEQRLRDDGVYVMNIIDYGPRAFLRAELATLATRFDHLAAIGREGSLDPDATEGGGNHVVVASDRPLPLDAIREANRLRGADDQIIAGEELEAFIGDAMVLTDDYAPVDQLLTPRAPR